MPPAASVNSDWQFPRTVNYTGYSADVTGTTAGAVGATGNLGAAPTAINADLKPGACLQLCAGSTLRSALKIAGAASGSDASPDDGYSAGQPIAGMQTPPVFVSEEWDGFAQNRVNALEGVTANLRSGGRVPVVTNQTCKVLVKGTVFAGLTLLEPVSGQFYLQPTSRGGGGMVYSNTAISAVSNTNSTESVYDKNYTIPANTINVGDVFRVKYQVTVNTLVGSDTLDLRLRIGGLTGTAIIDTGAVAPAASGNVLSGEAVIVIRTIGASGTFVATSTYTKTGAASGTATETFVGVTGSTAINTLTTQQIAVTAAWNSANANLSSLAILVIEKLAASSGGLGNGHVAVAMETPTSQPTSTAAMVRVKLLGGPA